MNSTLLLVTMCLTSQTAPTTQADLLHEIIQEEWERTMRENPTWASSLGDRRYNTKWADLSPEAIERSHEKDVQVLKKLDAIQVDQLPPEEKINYQLFRRKYDLAVKAHQYRWYLVPLNQRGGIQDEGALAESLRFETVQDFDDWLARMRAFPAYMDQTIALMREGAMSGVIHSRVVMERVRSQIDKQLVAEPRAQQFFKPFTRIPDSVSLVQKRRLRNEAAISVQKEILPSYLKFKKFFEEEYLPACYEKVGVWQIPNGGELYELRCREFTTTNLTPTQIHSIGLAEVERIRGEMDAVIEELKFTGSFEEFLEFLRTNPAFYYENGDDLLRAYMSVCKQIDPQLVKLFKKLPRVPYGVEPIPTQIAPDTTTAYYRSPSPDGSRAGIYFVNLYRPEVRPRYEIEALSLHESVPGHHLQIALAQELDNLPRFRRYSGDTVYIEGWALYAESLGDELGMYRDPYSRFGQLTYEMWRAVRLVVDTGIHHQRWDRQRAIDYFAANTAKSIHDIENEIDRYISWPGQALAYKIGELKFQELRKKSEQQLGEKFDIRDFHDVVLRNGAVTLEILEDQVNDWIKSQK
ncbi:DUF885 domain-containing protein [Thalassoglobus polymorphus]|uniref:DUF885 domain-containing protein n=1 Tax=Thalassoglobus polymorphus TaxID=2527994 RepID=A0A517QIF0_9PLAN|nr:DUF885 domain-containing protein [Thalassoglobus polymorphus]QDT31385.1 hypothetical protein Mal48_06180 [Thalassoglobus polymorphus]